MAKNTEFSFDFGSENQFNFNTEGSYFNHFQVNDSSSIPKFGSPDNNFFSFSNGEFTFELPDIKTSTDAKTVVTDASSNVQLNFNIGDAYLPAPPSSPAISPIPSSIANFIDPENEATPTVKNASFEKGEEKEVCDSIEQGKEKTIVEQEAASIEIIAETPATTIPTDIEPMKKDTEEDIRKDKEKEKEKEKVEKEEKVNVEEKEKPKERKNKSTIEIKKVSCTTEMLTPQVLEEIRKDASMIEISRMVKLIGSEHNKTFTEKEKKLLDEKLRLLKTQYAKVEQLLRAKTKEGFDLVKEIDEKIVQSSSLISLEEQTNKTEQFEKFVDEFEKKVIENNQKIEDLANNKIPLLAKEHAEKIRKPYTRLDDLEKANSTGDSGFQILEKTIDEFFHAMVEKSKKIDVSYKEYQKFIDEEEQFLQARNAKARQELEASKMEEAKLAELVKEAETKGLKLQENLEKLQKEVEDKRNSKLELQEEANKLNAQINEKKAMQDEAMKKCQQIYSEYGHDPTLKNKLMLHKEDIQKMMADLTINLESKMSQFNLTRYELDRFIEMIERNQPRVQVLQEQLKEATNQLQDIKAQNSSEEESSIDLL